MGAEPRTADLPRCREHGNVKPCPFDVVDEWWVQSVLRDMDGGGSPPHLRGDCASCDEARRRRDPVVEQLPLGTVVAALLEAESPQIAQEPQ